MNVKELKQLIKDEVENIKADKVEIRKPHVYPITALTQSRLSSRKSKIRAYYTLYAFLRGKSPLSVENGKPPSEFNTLLFVKGMLTEEALPLFKQWLKAV